MAIMTDAQSHFAQNEFTKFVGKKIHHNFNERLRPFLTICMHRCDKKVSYGMFRIIKTNLKTNQMRTRAALTSNQATFQQKRPRSRGGT